MGQLVDEGKFRKELYYRLNVLGLVVPALRERRSDIVRLSESFILQHSAKLGRRPAKLSKSCVEFLQQYPWPGNVRQLQNALFRALSLLDDMCKAGVTMDVSIFAQRTRRVRRAGNGSERYL